MICNSVNYYPQQRGCFVICTYALWYAHLLSLLNLSNKFCWFCKYKILLRYIGFQVKTSNTTQKIKPSKQTQINNMNISYFCQCWFFTSFSDEVFGELLWTRFSHQNTHKGHNSKNISKHIWVCNMHISYHR